MCGLTIRPIGYLSSLAIAAGLLAPAAMATPYDTPQSIAGTYNMFVTGNLGTASAPFLSPTLPGGDSQLDAGANGGGSQSAIYLTSSTRVNNPGYWAAVQRSGAPATPATPLDVFGTSTDTVNAATSLTALSGGTDVSVNDGTINITLSNNGLNVVDLNVANGATITGIDVTNPHGVVPTGLIINVNGNNLNFSGGSINLGSLADNQVLFNFGNAKSLMLSSLVFDGASLAPLATVNFSSGKIDAALIIKTKTGSGQVGYLGFNDPLPPNQISVLGGETRVAATPEPGSTALFATGLMVLGLFLWRRQARAAST